MSDFILPLDISSLDIISQSIDIKGNIVLTVESKNDKIVCHKCGNDAPKRYGYSGMLEIRHTSVFDKPVMPVRYECEHCDDHTTTTEKYS